MRETAVPGSPPQPPPDAAPATPDPLAADVAAAVAALRRDAGLSERAAARKLGTSQTQLRRMEDPRYLPSLRSLARLAAAFGHRLTIEFLPQDARGRKAAAASASGSPSKGPLGARDPGRGAARLPSRSVAQRRRS
ncbi:MAG: helix-turn-helix domain-containing protein [Candidatus Limnocylindria bacterium]